MKIKSDLNGERRRKMDEIAVLIPCFNEEITVGKVVRDFKRARMRQKAPDNCHRRQNKRKPRQKKSARQ